MNAKFVRSSLLHTFLAYNMMTSVNVFHPRLEIRDRNDREKSFSHYKHFNLFNDVFKNFHKIICTKLYEKVIIPVFCGKKRQYFRKRTTVYILGHTGSTLLGRYRLVFGLHNLVHQEYWSHGHNNVLHQNLIIIRF